MIIFDEKAWAERCLNNRRFFTNKFQGKEKCAISKYLSSQGYSDCEILKEILKLPLYYYDGLNNEQKKDIINKVIKKSKDYPFISDVEISILEDEWLKILSIHNKKKQRLYFIYLVYYKWASQIQYLTYGDISNKNNMVFYKEKELYQLARICCSRQEKGKLNKFLIDLDLIRQDSRKEYGALFVPVGSGDILFNIKGLELNNLLKVLNYRLLNQKYICCKKCGDVCAIPKIGRTRIYCTNCSKEEIKKKDRSRKLGKNSTKSTSV